MAAQSGMRSLERVFDILEVLAESSGPLRLSDVAAACELPLSTTQRILNSLIDRGYIERTGTLYEVGLGVMPLAHAYLLHNPLSRASHSVLEDLSRSTGMAASLYVRSGDARIVVSRVMGPAAPRYIFPIGERVPLTLGAGRTLIAWDEESELQELFDRTAPLHDARGDEVHFEDLLDSLAQIREDGYYVARNERQLGVASVSAPVFNADGRPLGVLLISGLDSEFTEDKVPAISRLAVLAGRSLGEELPGRAASGARRK